MITIVTVCFNEQLDIGKTMQSIYEQTYRDYEYIIKDGGSRDGTMPTIRRWEDAFKKRNISIKVISGPDKGLYDAMNTAVNEASGEFVNFMNAGDCFFSKDVLQNVFDKKDHTGADLLYGDTAEEEFGELHYFRKCPELIESRMPFSHQSVFVRRELLKEFPFDLKYKIAADYDFLLTLHERGYVFKDTETIIAKVSKTGRSSVRLKDTYVETMELRKAHGIQVPEGKALQKELFWLDIKQFGMDYFPTPLKYVIRKAQRLMRGQKKI